jgi:hypothetical protein
MPKKGNKKMALLAKPKPTAYIISDKGYKKLQAEREQAGEAKKQIFEIAEAFEKKCNEKKK